MKNKFTVEYFDDINKDMLDASSRISIYEKQYLEILKSGISTDTLKDMLEYDFEIYKLKKYLHAKAAFYSYESCEYQRYQADKLQTSITSLEDAKEKLLALHLAKDKLMSEKEPLNKPKDRTFIFYLNVDEYIK